MVWKVVYNFPIFSHILGRVHHQPVMDDDVFFGVFLRKVIVAVCCRLAVVKAIRYVTWSNLEDGYQRNNMGSCNVYQCYTHQGFRLCGG